MKSISAPQYRDGVYLPVVHAYYDRADMLCTTFDMTEHAHTLCEIMYVNEGSIQVHASGHCVSVGRGQFIWLDASVRHRLILDSAIPCGVMNIEFQLEELPARGPSFASLCRMDANLRTMLEKQPAYLVLADNERLVYNLLKQIILLTDSMHPEAEALCSWLTSQVLMQMARCHAQSGRQTGAPIKNHYVAAAVAFIDAHYLDNITASEIAGTLHVQATYLHRLFKEHMHMTIGDFINSLRLEHARALLVQTDQTLLKIAVASGFSSQQRFTALFRRDVGMTPSEYRNLTID